MNIEKSKFYERRTKLKKLMLCMCILLMAQAATASVTVDFTSPAGTYASKVGNLITLDFTVDGSGNVTLDASTDLDVQAAIDQVDGLDGPVGTVSAGFGQSFSILITGENTVGASNVALRIDGLADAGLGVTGRNPNRIEYYTYESQSNVAAFEVDISSLAASDVFRFEEYSIGASVNGPNADALVTSFRGSTVNSGTLAASQTITNINTSDFWLMGGNSGTVSWEQDATVVQEGDTDGYGLGSVTFDIVPAPPGPPLTVSFPYDGMNPAPDPNFADPAGIINLDPIVMTFTIDGSGNVSLDTQTGNPNAQTMWDEPNMATVLDSALFNTSFTITMDGTGDLRCAEGGTKFANGNGGIGIQGLNQWQISPDEVVDLTLSGLPQGCYIEMTNIQTGGWTDSGTIHVYDADSSETYSMTANEVIDISYQGFDIHNGESIYVTCPTGGTPLYAFSFNIVTSALAPINPADGDLAAADANLNLEWTNWSSENLVDDVYVDVWFGTEPNKLGGNYTKVVDGDPNVTNVLVDASAVGTYYWQVDTNRDGSYNESTQIEGPVWSFTTTQLPIITSGPENVYADEGASGTFTVTVANSPTSYSWYKVDPDTQNPMDILIDDGAGTKYVNEDSNSLTINNIDAGDTGYYYCIASNGFGDSAPSDTAMLMKDVVVHLDASNPDNVITSGTVVTEWTDLSGNGNHANVIVGVGDPNFPSYPSSLSATGLPGVDMGDGRNGFRLFTIAECDSFMDLSGAASGNTGFSMMIAFKAEAILGGLIRDVVMANHGKAYEPNSLTIRYEGGAIKFTTAGNIYESGNYESDRAVQPGDSVVVALNYNASTGAYEFWNSKTGSSTTGTLPAHHNFSSTQALYLGTSLNPGQYMDGMIGEVKIYSYNMAAVDFEAECQAMLQKWCDPHPLIVPNTRFFHVDDFLSWDLANSPKAPYYASSVPLKSRIEVPAALKAHPNARSGEGGIQVLDSFSGTLPQGSIGSLYTFEYWQYVDLMVDWNGSAGGGIICPPHVDVIDNAHRNGVPILGTIYFPPGKFGGELSWVKDFLQKEGDTFPVADKLIDVAEHYGFDGWFINQETEGTDPNDAANMRDLIKYVRDNSDLHISWYDAMNESGSIGYQGTFNNNNDWFMKYNGDDIAGSMFINYGIGASGINASHNKAVAMGVDPFVLYAGLLVGDPNATISESLCDNLFPSTGHKLSMGLYRPGDRKETSSAQSAFWIGETPDPREDGGVTPYIAAESSITEVPFTTNFCLGRGTYFYVNGTRKSTRTWWNRSLQDVLPTWRWIIDAAGPDPNVLTPEIIAADAYNGGQCLRVNGHLATDNTMRLYLTDLPIQSDTNLKVTFKRGAAVASQLQVGISLASAPATFIYFDAGANTSDGWDTTNIPVGTYAGERIAAIGLKFLATPPDPGYTINIGQLGVYNANDPTPQAPMNVSIIGGSLGDQQLNLRWAPSPSEVYYYNVFSELEGGGLLYCGSTPNNYYYTSVASPNAVGIAVVAVGPDMSHSPVSRSLFPEDLDGSGRVDLGDFACFAPHWQQDTLSGNFDDAGVVGLDDLTVLITKWLDVQ